MFQAVRDEVRERAHRFSILRSRKLKMTENNVASVIFDNNILVHPDTTMVDTSYLDSKNYGAPYTEPVIADLVDPDTTAVGYLYLYKLSPSKTTKRNT